MYVGAAHLNRTNPDEPSKPSLHNQIQVQIAFRPTANGKDSDVGGAILGVHADMYLVKTELASAGMTTTVLPSIGFGHVEAGHKGLAVCDGDHPGLAHHAPLGS